MIPPFLGLRLKGPSDSRLLAAIDDGITSSTENADLDTIRTEISSHVESSQKLQKYRYDKTRTKPKEHLHLANKLRRCHVYFHNQKIKVKFFLL